MLLETLLTIFFWSLDEKHPVDQFPVGRTFEEGDIQENQGPPTRERTATIEPYIGDFRKSNIDPFPHLRV